MDIDIVTAVIRDPATSPTAIFAHLARGSFGTRAFNGITVDLRDGAAA